MKEPEGELSSINKTIKKKKKKKRVVTIRCKKHYTEIEPQGPGPWKVFMLVNVDETEEGKKQTEIRLATYPELVKQIKNAQDRGNWVIVMKLGDFHSSRFASRVFAEWSEGTRGQGPRIAQGLVLFQKYESYGINISILDQPKKEVQIIFREKKALLVAHELDQERQLIANLVPIPISGINESSSSSSSRSLNSSSSSSSVNETGTLTVREVMKHDSLRSKLRSIK